MFLCSPVIDGIINLPVPADGTDQYTKNEAVGIIQDTTAKGTTFRTNVMKAMIELGLVPSCMRTLMRIMDRNDS